MVDARAFLAAVIGVAGLALADGVARFVSGDGGSPTFTAALVALGAALALGAVAGLALCVGLRAATALGPARSLFAGVIARAAAAPVPVVAVALAAFLAPLAAAVPLRARLAPNAPLAAATADLAALAVGWGLASVVVRRFGEGKGRRLGRRSVGWALAAIAVVGVGVSAAFRPELDVAGVWDLVLLGALVPACGGAALLLPRLARNVRAIAIACAAGLVAGFLALAALDSSDRLREAVGEGWRPASWAMRLAMIATDADRDGFSSRFGGGDCDDRRDDVGPGAIEIPGNGIDENCRDGDSAPVAPWPERPTFVPLPEGAREPRSVILLSVDTFRADHLGVYGYGRPTTPRLQELAAKSVLFERAYSSAPTTHLSLPVLLTGRTIGEIPWDRRTSPYGVLDTVDTLPEILAREKGFHTAVLVTHRFLTPKWGWDQGFSEKDGALLYPESVFRKISTGDKLAARLSRWIERHKNERFFVWAHLMDAHASFLKHPEGPDFGDGVLDRYDSEIWYVDRTIGKIADALERLGIADDTMLVVTGDHGELFGEHGRSGHGSSLYEEVARIPLLVRSPGLGPAVSACVTGNVDVAPTILNLVGVDGGAFGMSGASLVPDAAGAPCPADREITAEIRYGRMSAPDVRGIIGQRWKLVSNVKTGTYKLFDLERDPEEARSVAAEERERFDAMKRRLLAWTDIYADRDLREATAQLTSEGVPAGAERTGAVFENGVELVAIDFGERLVTRDAPAHFQLYFRTKGRVREECVFVFQLADAAGAAVYDARMPFVSGSLPLARWPLGRIVNDGVGVELRGPHKRAKRIEPGSYGARLYLVCEGNTVLAEEGPRDGEGRATLGAVRVGADEKRRKRDAR